MNVFSVPWLDLTVLVPLAGAAGAAFCTGGGARRRWGSVVTGATLACALLA